MLGGVEGTNLEHRVSFLQDETVKFFPSVFVVFGSLSVCFAAKIFAIVADSVGASCSALVTIFSTTSRVCAIFFIAWHDAAAVESPCEGGGSRAGLAGEKDK